MKVVKELVASADMSVVVILLLPRFRFFRCPKHFHVDPHDPLEREYVARPRHVAHWDPQDLAELVHERLLGEAPELGGGHHHAV